MGRRRVSRRFVKNRLGFYCERLIDTLKLLKPYNGQKFTSGCTRTRLSRYSLSASAAQMTLQTPPMLGAFLQISPDRLENSSVWHAQEGPITEKWGFLLGKGFVVMDAGGDGSDFVSTAGRRSGDSRPGASDSEAIDLRGSSASCSRGGDGGWNSNGGSS